MNRIRILRVIGAATSYGEIVHVFGFPMATVYGALKYSRMIHHRKEDEDCHSAVRHGKMPEFLERSEACPSSCP